MVSEQPEVSDPMETLWQDVDEEPLDEIERRELHGFVALGSLKAVILILKSHGVAVVTDQSLVRDGHAMGVQR